MKKSVTITDKMQNKYQYVLSEPIGKHFDSEFKPQLTPREMLSMGVFGGIYMRDCTKEFPKDWFTNAKFAIGNTQDLKLNYFQVKASLPLQIWKEKGWIYEEDPRGWFQWYCRYYMGRRIPVEDQRQIKRWKAMRRHIAQLRNNCSQGDMTCRRKQRQALLHWAYDTRK
ncbi:hypothetical protein H7Y21_00585 [Arenimonas sp.]|nr:hypothetical protein [Candidatus Parcubacteria bacterium]